MSIFFLHNEMLYDLSHHTCLMQFCKLNNWRWTMWPTIGFQLLAFCHGLILCSATKENKRTKELKLRYIAPLQHSFRVANQFHCKNTRRRRMSNVTTTLCLRLHQWKTRPTHRKKILYTLALFTAFVSLTTKLVKTQTHQLYYNYSRRRFAESVLNDS